MHPALRLVRVGNVAVSFVGTIVGGLAALGSGLALSPLLWLYVLLAAVSTAFVTAGGNVLNDLLDLDGDRTNHPDRPLVTGAISTERARLLATGLFVGGIEVAIPVVFAKPLVGAILAVAIGALLAYELRLKANGFAGNLVVALLTGLVFLYGAAAVGAPLLMVPFAAMAFLATLSREIIKDTEDMAGDVDRRTLPMAHGVAFASGAARVSVGAAIALSVAPLFWFVDPASLVGIMYFALVVAADAIFAVSVGYLPQRLHWEQTVSKVAMSVALLAFLAVAFR